MATDYATETDNSWEIPSFEESNGKFELIEEGNYVLELVEVGPQEPVSPQWDKTGKKKRAKFVFEVRDDPDYEGYRINSWMNITLNERAALYKITKALVGGELDPATRYTPSMLVGKRMMATVVHGDPDSQNRVWPQIQSALPVKPRRGRKTTIEDVAATMDAEEIDPNNPPF